MTAGATLRPFVLVGPRFDCRQPPFRLLAKEARLRFKIFDARLDPPEPPVDAIEASIDTIETSINVIEAFVDVIEALLCRDRKRIDAFMHRHVASLPSEVQPFERASLTGNRDRLAFDRERLSRKEAFDSVELGFAGHECGFAFLKRGSGCGPSGP